MVMKLGIMVTVNGIKMVQTKMKYISRLPLYSKNTKLYAARMPVSSLNRVTILATINVFKVIRKNGILESTPA
jgi:hypothetical protein